MLRFFSKKNKAVISVFLCCILLPTYIFEGVIIDASRLFGAKSFVSEAGQLTMNGALSNFDQALNDAYGLVAMSKTPAELKQNLQAYFVNTLTGADISVEAAEYTVGQIVGDQSNTAPIMFTSIDSFEIEQVPNTQVYQPEVMKSQVMEYMKYRAPAMLAKREVYDRLRTGEFKRLDKQREAANAQVKFENEMDDLQTDCDKLKSLLDEHNEKVNKYNTTKFNKDTKAVYKSYQERITYLSIIQQKLDRMDQAQLETTDPAEDLMREIVNNDTHSSIADASGAELSTLGGNLLQQYKDYLLLYDKSDEIAEVRENDPALGEQYDQACERMLRHMQDIRPKIDDLWKEQANLLTEDEKAAKEEADNIKAINKQLDKVQKKLKKLQEDYDDWGEKIAAIPDQTRYSNDLHQNEIPDDEKDTTKQSMDDYRTQNYSEFSSDKDNIIQQLRDKVDANKTYYENISEYLDTFQFAGEKIQKKGGADQYIGHAYGYCNNSYKSTSVVSEASAFLNNEWQPSTYQISGQDVTRIAEDAFYAKVQQYCQKDGEEDQDKAKEDNGDLSSAITELWTLFATDDITATMDDDVPSAWVNQGYNAVSGSAQQSYGSTDVTNKSNRKNLTNLFTNNNQASSELSGLAALGDWLNTKGADAMENLYLDEYIIDMFSNYTSNKWAEASDQKMQTRSNDDPLSISGVHLKNDVLYRSEVEYIIYGKKNAAENVRIAKGVMFGIQLVGNSVSGLTNKKLQLQCETLSKLFPGGALTHKAVASVLMILCILIESLRDLDTLVNGGRVLLYKLHTDQKDQWNTYPLTVVANGLTGNVANPSSDSGFSMSYTDYLWLIILLHMHSDNLEDNMMMRAADCIEKNMPKLGGQSIKNEYTMVRMQAQVTPRTDFLQRVPQYVGGNLTFSPYKIRYTGVMGE